MGEIIGAGTASYAERSILAAAGAGNILPLTSSCNVRCLFCSHQQNPPEVEVFRILPRSLEAVEQVLSFMDPERPVVIGESVTRVIEGEPLTHPRFVEVLQLVRATFPHTTIQITTNGSLLDEGMADLLGRLGKVVVYLSLNSASVLGRALLMGDVNNTRAAESALHLKKSGVPFHGSVVAMPHLVGWDDLEKTITYLCACGAETVRVFLPGFTTLAPPALRFEPSLWEELNAFIIRLREKIEVPLTCEPPRITNLEAEVAGVLAGSPAARAGVRCGDVIEAVDGAPVCSRVHAFRRVQKAGLAEIILRRGKDTLSVQVHKKPGEKSGLVMDYDLDPALVEDIVRAARRRGADRILVLTSQLAGPVLQMGLARLWREVAEVTAWVVENHFFGGSIKAAGLLTVADFGHGVEEYLKSRPGETVQLALLPGTAFDPRGRDLTGCSYLDLQERFGIPFEAL